MTTHQGGEYPQSPVDEGLIELHLGQPSPSLLPLSMLEGAARARLSPDNDPLVLQYGAARGPLGFREALARFLERELGEPVAADGLAITAGISSTLGLVAQAFARPGQAVITGDPTYFLARGIFEAAGLEVIGVPVDARGLDVEALERRLSGGLRIALAYVIPSFHNPTSVCLDPARAERLVELAERHEFVVVADEPYPMLHFERAPAPMRRYDRGRGRVLSLGSFSKILAPGLRLGWLEGEPSLVRRFTRHGVLLSGGGLNPLVASLVHELLESGALEAHVAGLRRVLASRAEALADALETHAPELSFVRPEGGYFLWGELPEGADAARLAEHARARHAVGFTPGARCAGSRELSRNLRLSFSFYDEVELAEGARRLGHALRARRP